jgi:hypothetical protein
VLSNHHVIELEHTGQNCPAFFVLESGFLGNFEKYLKNSVTFRSGSRLYNIGTVVMGRSCWAAFRKKPWAKNEGN